jgi:hypothetical protein
LTFNMSLSRSPGQYGPLGKHLDFVADPDACGLRQTRSISPAPPIRHR